MAYDRCVAATAANALPAWQNVQQHNSPPQRSELPSNPHTLGASQGGRAVRNDTQVLRPQLYKDTDRVDGAEPPRSRPVSEAHQSHGEQGLAGARPCVM